MADQGALQTYDTNELSIAAQDAQVKTLQVCVSTSLMTHYEPARSVDVRHALAVAEDAVGHPMVFSVGTNDELYAVLQIGNAGKVWSQYDLTTCLGVGISVTTFALLQTSDDGLYLAVSIVDADKKPRFYVTRRLSNDVTSSVWSAAFQDQWVERAVSSHSWSDSQSCTSIDHILMTAGASAGSPPAVIATVTLSDGKQTRAWVNADPSLQTDAWQDWPTPQGATVIRDVEVGFHPRLKFGSYALYDVAGQVQIDFTASQKQFNQYASGSVTVPAGAAAMTAVQAGDGTTDLYIVDKDGGLYLHTSATIGATNATASPVQIAASRSTVAGNSDPQIEIIARQVGGTAAVWVLIDGVLSYLQGTSDGSATTWSAPLEVMDNVGQIAALRNKTRNANDLFLVDADEQLVYLYQDPSTTIWSSHVLPLADLGSALPFQCYATHVTLRDQDDNPVVRNFCLSASQWSYLTVNGSSVICAPDATPEVWSDGTGCLTIMSKVSGLSTPTFSLSADFLDSVIDVNPQAIINNNLKSFSSGTALDGAVTQTGERVLSGGGSLTSDQAAQALSSLTQLHDSNGQDGSTGVSIRAASAPTGNLIKASSATGLSFAVSGLGTPGVAFHDGAQVRQAVPDLCDHADSVDPSLPPHQVSLTVAGNKMFAAVGDFFHHMVSGCAKFEAFAITVADDIAKFTIKAADTIATFVLDTAEKVMHAMEYVLHEIEIGFEKVLDWLGFVFGWDDIIKGHKVITCGSDAVIGWAKKEVGNAKAMADAFFDDLNDKIRNTAKVSSTPSSASSSMMDQGVRDQARNLLDGNSGRKAAHDYMRSPAGSFASYHLKHSKVFDTSTSSNLNLKVPGDQILSKIQKYFGPVINSSILTAVDLFKTLQDGVVTNGASNRTVINTFQNGIQVAQDLVTDVKGATDGCLEIVEDLLDDVRDGLDDHIDIPFLSAFYKLVTEGSELSLIDAVALLLAVPAIPMYKALSGKSPFGDGTPALADSSGGPDRYFTRFNSSKLAATTGVSKVSDKAEDAPSKEEASSSDSSLTSDVLYSQIGGVIFCVTEVVAGVFDALNTEDEGEGGGEGTGDGIELQEPGSAAPANNAGTTAQGKGLVSPAGFQLLCEIIMIAFSYPVGDEDWVLPLRVLWGSNIFMLFRLYASALVGPPAEPVVGVMDCFAGVEKLIIFIVVIVEQTIADTDDDLYWDWQTMSGNVLDAIGRGVSGAAKVDVDKEFTGLIADAIAVGLSGGAASTDYFRIGAILGGDASRRYRCF